MLLPPNQAEGQQSVALDTFPKLLLNHARVRGNKVAMREKDLGIWQSWSWSQVAEEVRALACGLAALGFQPGDKLAIVGDNRPRLYWSMAAAQCLGGIPIPLYQDAVAEEMVFVLDNADVRFAVVEDQEQVDKLLEAREQSPKIEHILFDDPRGLRHYDYPFLTSIDKAQEMGRAYDREHPGFFEKMAGSTSGSDICIMLYTSGTTGNPKGVVLTNDNVIITARNGIIREGLTENEEVLAYLPMAWVGDNLFSYAQSYVAGFTINCPESGATVMTDLREIGPTYYFAPPRVYENMLTQVMIRMEDASKIKQRLFHYFMEHAKDTGTRILDGKPVSFMDRLLYKLGNFFVYGPLRDVLGLGRIKLAYTAGEAIGPEIFDFYRSLGINIKQLYGQTEGMVFICVQPDGEVYADTVGTPAIDVEIRIDDSGEVLYRSPGVFHSYYKNPESTAKTKTEDGWVYTGDAGYFAENGHLKIIDRAKDVGKLNDGTLFAPKYIENKLKFFSFIKEVVAFGNARDYAAVFINIDLEAVGNWAERRNLAYSGYTDLANQDVIYDMIQECVEQVNMDLSKDPLLANSQIKRFLILHKELDPDDGELTRTRKVRRNFIAERYGPLMDALYSDVDVKHVETQVKFEDGRSGILTADVKVRNTKTFTPVKAVS
ncbi:AMP-binding protein [Sedimenticola hydrogenitrophicus]|uniref:AMP-binding protein n=1 Tax=Sedimenticola hydrogenitrophicus TaxID=2967975 RepID=UPI0023B17F47|nr:AMP-binding protein [Sedimenticola hydrogenitrophicus]